MVGTFTESTAGSARTAPVDDTVNGALALRSRVAVRASVFDERSEASGLELIPTSLRSQLELPCGPEPPFVANADTDVVNHDCDGMSARKSANNGFLIRRHH